MFLQGLLIGFAIAVPVGPIGFLCLRRTLVHGRLTGFVSGLGAATADALFGAVAALGLSAVSEFILGIERWLQLGGGLFLLVLGVLTMRARPPATATDPATPAPQRGLPSAFFSTLALTLTNPATVLAFLAIFAGVGVHLTGSLLQGGSLVAGVFFGSALWWLTLAYGAGALFARLHASALQTLHVVSGFCIAALGAWQLGALTSRWLG